MIMAHIIRLADKVRAKQPIAPRQEAEVLPFAPKKPVQPMPSALLAPRRPIQPALSELLELAVHLLVIVVSAILVMLWLTER
jgi:hypothetical protein